MTLTHCTCQPVIAPIRLLRIAQEANGSESETLRETSVPYTLSIITIDYIHKITLKYLAENCK
jgi:hypothetical protein